MLPCLQISKIDRLVNTINKAQKIMRQFEEHLFPVQKIQFYLLKCRIYEYSSRQLGICCNLVLGYQFPMGLFELIYKSLQVWKQGKVLHYVNMLVKMLFASVRNELLSIDDMYVLGWEVKLLLRVVKKRETFVEEVVERYDNNNERQHKKLVSNYHQQQVNHHNNNNNHKYHHNSNTNNDNTINTPTRSHSPKTDSINTKYNNNNSINKQNINNNKNNS